MKGLLFRDHIKGPLSHLSHLFACLQNVTSVRGDRGLHGARSRASSRNRLASKVGQEVGRRLAEGTAAAKDVDLAAAAQGRGALAGVRSSGHSEHAAGEGRGLDLDGDVLEDVALGEDHGAGADLEGVAGAGVVVPVVVHSVQQGVAGQLGRAAREVVDVVVDEGDHVRGAVEVLAPVVVAVAGGRVGSSAVEEVVGDGHAAGGLGAEDKVLAANFGGLGWKHVSIMCRHVF